MYVDANLLVAGSLALGTNVLTGKTVSATNATVVGDNVVDLGANLRDMGEGQALYARFEVTTAFSGGTSVEFQVTASDDTSQVTNPKVLATTGAIPVASLVAGARFAVPIAPVIGSKGQRYLGVKFVVVGTSAGAAIADFGLDVQDGQKFYPSGFSVT